MRLPNDPGPGPASLVGLLGGVALGSLSITLLFLGMRSVMAIGGACADGGPFIPVRPCPSGVPVAMTAAIFGIFGSVGLVILCGSRFGSRWAGLAFLGWPALFISLGWNFLEFGLHPPGGDGLDWGWLLCGVVFVIMGAAPLVVAVLAVRMAGAEPTTSGRGPGGVRAAARTAISSAGASVGRMAGAPGEDLVLRLERLADLHRRGDLSDAEYEAAKQRLLAISSPAR